MKKRVVVGMSGGVDSSVSAHILKEAGHEVVGLFMKNWDSALNKDVLGNPDLASDLCPQEKDYQDAKRVADKLGIELHRVEFIEEYWQDVFTYFLDEYKKGRTPNPDILCNKHIKFDAFRRHAERFSPDAIAMGHYARIREDEGGLRLLRGVDANKDQTYFLSQLTEKKLRNVLFPIGELTKAEVREIAKKASLPTADKKDSTGICFIGERSFAQFLKNYLPAQKGLIKTEDGDTVGEHEGLMHYTIGQRKGLGIGGLKNYPDKPWFVIGKDLDRNILIVGQGYHHPGLYATSCTLDDLNIITAGTFREKAPLQAKFRHRQKDKPVRVERIAGVWHVLFEKPVRAVTPGQACVLYDEETCLGGGFIDKVKKDDTILPY